MSRRSFGITFANLRQPMPLPRKAWLFARNNWYKVRHQTLCCGNPGQPGC